MAPERRKLPFKSARNHGPMNSLRPRIGPREQHSRSGGGLAELKQSETVPARADAACRIAFASSISTIR